MQLSPIEYSGVLVYTVAYSCGVTVIYDTELCTYRSTCTLFSSVECTALVFRLDVSVVRL